MRIGLVYLALVVAGCQGTPFAWVVEVDDQSAVVEFSGIAMVGDVQMAAREACGMGQLGAAPAQIGDSWQDEETGYMRARFACP